MIVNFQSLTSLLQAGSGACSSRGQKKRAKPLRKEGTQLGPHGFPSLVPYERTKPQFT